MKFVCERCQTRYSIADDKVRQKILKIRCKTCENVITVREGSGDEPRGDVSRPPAPQSMSRSVPPSPGAGAREWFVAINGEQEGPSNRVEIAARITRCRPDDDVYVWKEGMDGW